MDAEIICEWMEPLATVECTTGGKRSMLDWWRRETEWSDSLKWKPWTPTTLTLDALHKVEERLIRSDIKKAFSYDLELSRVGRWMWHIDSTARVKALAAVLKAGIRTPVEGEKP